MDLNKDQLDFLITLSKIGKIYGDVIADSQLKMINFLEDNKFVNEIGRAHV